MFHELQTLQCKRDKISFINQYQLNKTPSVLNSSVALPAKENTEQLNTQIFIFFPV